MIGHKDSSLIISLFPFSIMKLALLLFLSGLARAPPLPLPLPQTFDADVRPYHTLFPAETTTSTMNLTTTTVIPSLTTQVSVAVTSVSRSANIMEIVSSSICVAIFLISCLVAVVQFKRQLDQNPGDVGQALERLLLDLTNVGYRVTRLDGQI